MAFTEAGKSSDGGNMKNIRMSLSPLKSLDTKRWSTTEQLYKKLEKK